MNINYKIKFHTDWHCGSGLAAGADVDALVVKDKDGLPYVPGKTIKGLVREAMEDMMTFSNKTVAQDSQYIKTFGLFCDADNKNRGEIFFNNAELSKEEKDTIISNNAARFMYRSISNTAIDDSGITKEHSLRKTEVVIPCELHGQILNVHPELEDEIETTLKYIKRLGQNRNRGLGRCTISRED